MTTLAHSITVYDYIHRTVAFLINEQLDLSPFSVTLGYLSWFPSMMVNAWSSGTGMAGVLGASIYIIFGLCRDLHILIVVSTIIYRCIKVLLSRSSPLKDTLGVFFHALSFL